MLRMEEWPLFLCYRQVDGLKVADWLHRHLHGRAVTVTGAVPGDEPPPKLDVYFDQTAPAVADWRARHKPALERSKALLFICTPGAHVNLGGEDWVHRELDWWIGHRRAAPIVIETTGEGDRWVPEAIRKRWPYAQRVTIPLDGLDRLDAERVVERIVAGIVASESQVRDEDYERERRRSRVLAGALLIAMLALGIAGIQTIRATSAAREAQENADIANRRMEQILRINDARRLQVLQRQLDELWPAYPEQKPAMRRWLDQMEGLIAGIDLHRSALDELRSLALPWTEGERLDDWRSHPAVANLQQIFDDLPVPLADVFPVELLEALPPDVSEEDFISVFGDHFDSWIRSMLAVDGLDDGFQRKLAELQPEEAARQTFKQVSAAFERRTWTFGSPDDQAWHDALALLVSDLEVARTEAGILSEVRRRFQMATLVEQTAAEEADAWQVAIESIADVSVCPSYRGLRITPQPGLVPLGRDPRSGLWEFADVQSGDVPFRWLWRGSLSSSVDTAIVYVLLPPGRVRLLALVGVDVEELPDEAERARDVELDPFFISKYELTRSQWTPFAYGLERESLPGAPLPRDFNAQIVAEAIERLGSAVAKNHVTWREADAVARRARARLPTEAQWVFASLAGSLLPAGRDSVTDSQGPSRVSWGAIHKGVPNEWGLYGLEGNVAEWCVDRENIVFDAQRRRGDGAVVFSGPDDMARIYRGGSVDAGPDEAPADRAWAFPDRSDGHLGVRLVRPVLLP